MTQSVKRSQRIYFCQFLHPNWVWSQYIGKFSKPNKKKIWYLCIYNIPPVHWKLKNGIGLDLWPVVCSFGSRKQEVWIRKRRQEQILITYELKDSTTFAQPVYALNKTGNRRQNPIVIYLPVCIATFNFSLQIVWPFYFFFVSWFTTWLVSSRITLYTSIYNEYTSFNEN